VCRNFSTYAVAMYYLEVWVSGLLPCSVLLFY